MRGRASRRITATAVTASMVFGIAGAASTAMAAEQPEKRPVTVPADAPVPGLDAALAPLKALGPLGGVLSAVTDLLTAVSKADNGAVPAPDLAKLVDAVKAAIAKATPAAAPATPATPPAGLPLPLPLPLPPLPLPLPKLPVDKAATNGAPAAKAKADPVADALATVQKAVDQLVKDLTATPPNVGALVGDVTAVVTALLPALLAAVTGALGLPLPALPLPKLPLPLPLPLPVS